MAAILIWEVAASTAFSVGLPGIWPYAKLLASVLPVPCVYDGDSVALDTYSWLVVLYGKLTT